MKTTEENNKLIAEFMGYQIQTDPTERFFGRYKTPITKVWVKENELGFDTSWDWLMPVVEKIEGIIFDNDNSYNVTIGSTNYCVIQDSKGEVYELTEDYGETKLETVYISVVKFIEWYNEQNTNNQ